MSAVSIHTYQTATRTAPSADGRGQLDRARRAPGGGRGATGSSVWTTDGAVAVDEHPAQRRASTANASETARRAEQRGGPQPLGAAALHGADQQHAEAALGAVPLAEDGAGQRRRARRACSPSSSDGQQPGSCTAADAEPARRAERGEHVVGAARRRPTGRRRRRRRRRRTRRSRRRPSGPRSRPRTTSRHGATATHGRGVGDGGQAARSPAAATARHGGDEGGEERQRAADEQAARRRPHRGPGGPDVEVARVGRRSGGWPRPA